jgi:hypothetical protein
LRFNVELKANNFDAGFWKCGGSLFYKQSQEFKVCS